MEEIIDVTEISKDTVEVTKTVSDTVTTQYDYAFLYKQKQDIIADRDAYFSKRNEEIAYIDSILPADYKPATETINNVIG